MEQHVKVAGLAERYIDSFEAIRRFPIVAAALIHCVITFDGDVDESEMALIVQFFDTWNVAPKELGPLLDLSTQQLLTDLLGYSKNNFNDAAKKRLAEMSIVAALADEKLRYSELLIVELVVDALDVPGYVVDNVYKEITGRDFPSKADPSTIGYYASRKQTGSNGSTSSSAPSERDRLLFVLGLAADATLQQVRARYRELALTKHPDRAPAADESVKRRMHEEFLVIKQAYESLMVFYA